MRWAVLILMSFSYQFGANPPIDYVRALASDRQEFNPNGTRRYVFEDSEILMFSAMASGVWQSSQFYTGPGQGVATLPTVPVNYLRAAALALESMAGNAAYLSSIKQLLDVQLAPGVAAIQLRALAQEYREVDDNNMAFVVIEQCSTDWSVWDRFTKQIQRQQGS